MSNKSLPELLDQYLDDAVCNLATPPPAGLNDELASFVQTLIPSESVEGATEAIKKKVWRQVTEQVKHSNSETSTRRRPASGFVNWLIRPRFRMQWSFHFTSGLIIVSIILLSMIASSNTKGSFTEASVTPSVLLLSYTPTFVVATPSVISSTISSTPWNITNQFTYNCVPPHYQKLLLYFLCENTHFIPGFPPSDWQFPTSPIPFPTFSAR